MNSGFAVPPAVPCERLWVGMPTTTQVETWDGVAWSVTNLMRASGHSDEAG